MEGLILASAAAMLAGIFAQRRWADGAKALSGRLLEAVVYLVMPVVVFFTITQLEFTRSVGAGLAFGWAELLVSLVLADAIGVKLLHLPRPALGALMVSVVIANTGYLGIPLTSMLLGSDDEQVGLAVAYENLVNVPVVLSIGFAIGAAFGTKAGRTAGDRLKAFLLRNPPLYALIAALLIGDSFHPEWGHDLAHALALGIAPIGFFALGVNLMLERERSGERIFPPPMTGAVGAAIGIRLVAAPAVMLALSTLVIEVPDTFLLEAAMPAGINALVVSHLYGLDMRVTVGAITWTTAIVVALAAIAPLAGLG